MADSQLTALSVRCPSVAGVSVGAFVLCSSGAGHYVAVEEIDALVEALGKAGSPFLDVRRPGLTREELTAEVERCWPSWWVDYIDDEVEAWWAWQNGANPDAVAAGGSSVQGASVITPEGIRLTPVYELLAIELSITGHEFMREFGITLPIADFDGMSGYIMLRKLSPDAEWTVWEYIEGGFAGLDAEEGRLTDAPTFRHWLAALAGAVSAGRLVRGEYGELTSPAGHSAANSGYPWR